MIKAILVTCNIKTRQLTKQHLKKRKHNDNHQQPFGKHLRAECCGAVGETPSPEALQVTVLLMALQWLKKTLDHILFFSPYKKTPKGSSYSRGSFCVCCSGNLSSLFTPSSCEVFASVASVK